MNKIIDYLKDYNVRYITLIIVLLYMLLSEVHAQPQRPASKHNLVLEGRLHYGFLLSQHLELDAFQAHYPAFELSLQRATNGRQRWEFMYGYPILGVSLWVSNLGGFKEIGSAVAVYPFINFPLFQNQDQSLNFRLGVGLGYLTNHYDRLENYKNFAIGSAVNAAGSLFLEYRYKFNSRYTMALGFGLTHFSNGSIKTPNYGLNIFTVTAGFAFHLGKPNPYLKKHWRPELYPYEFDGRKYLHFYVGGHMAFKDMSAELGRRYVLMAFWMNLMKQVSYKSRFGFGFDFTYDFSDVDLLEDRFVESSFWNVSKPGVNAAYELMLDRLSFLFNFGMYLSGEEKSEGDVFQRLTLKYSIMRNLFAHLALNVHFGKAEYVALGLGYQLDFVYKRKIKHQK